MVQSFTLLLLIIRVKIMGTQGTLTDFSLPAIFQWLEKGQKTGVLAIHPFIGVRFASDTNLQSDVSVRGNTGNEEDRASTLKTRHGTSQESVRTSFEPTLPPVAKPKQINSSLQIQHFPNHYIWIAQGRIVAAANRFDGQGLISLIRRDQWVSDRVLSKLLQRCSLNHQPLGLWLKSNGVLDSAQLEQIFEIQLVEQIVPLFQLKNAQFKFELRAALPALEMTGLSISTTEATMMVSGALKQFSG
ncbi:hypothetical protein MC7420_1864 [Coleofasciculus chthonoplastes PCC 7420]|uniref:PatA-like N-terminal domain-containing protein n=1 Tax=Coleofasciculus chthonoplastes PCC 7420 TaxID=118168 RepID=B4VMV1_9CYAN|nr:DUF4388 domain-containing protein [Coleofasciculus chthonoplastes]EDX76861.1 hypothetical protein MC7420_1864 [Coleofasciculus chthonoplastes PCC 7420]